MRPESDEMPPEVECAPDETRQQAHNLDKRLCHSEIFSGMVTSGRTQAACNVNWGQGCKDADPGAPQERWRRGCRRADVSCWPWLLLQPWPVAPRRPKKLSRLNRLRSSRPLPANTSNGSGRACQPRLTQPAPNFALPRRSVVEGNGQISRLALACAPVVGQSRVNGDCESFTC